MVQALSDVQTVVKHDTLRTGAYVYEDRKVLLWYLRTMQIPPLLFYIDESNDNSDRSKWNQLSPYIRCVQEAHAH